MGHDPVRRRPDMIRVIVGGLALLMVFAVASPASADDCSLGACDTGPVVAPTTGALEASYFETRSGLGFATNAAPSLQPYHWRLVTQCQVSDPALGGCIPGEEACPPSPGRILGYYVVQRQRVVLPDRS